MSNATPTPAQDSLKPLGRTLKANGGRPHGPSAMATARRLAAAHLLPPPFPGECNILVWHTGGWLHARVSAQDGDLAEINWHLLVGGYCGVGRGHTLVSMHRIICARIVGRPLTKADRADHRYGDGLNNTRENLRVTTALGNRQNITAAPWGQSGYRGVYTTSKSPKWTARVQHLGKKIYLGLFTTREEAARVAAAKRAELGFLSSEATQ